MQHFRNYNTIQTRLNNNQVGIVYNKNCVYSCIIFTSNMADIGGNVSVSLIVVQWPVLLMFVGLRVDL